MRLAKALTWFGLVLLVLGLAACGMQGAPNFAKTEHTPIPTLPPATLPPVAEVLAQQAAQGPVAAPCRTTPVDLLAAWFVAGLPGPDAGPFTFTDLDGNTCQVTFDDVLFVFTKAGIWYENSPACTACHAGDPATNVAFGYLSLDSYEHIIQGAQKPDGAQDILGGGNWEQSILYDSLVVKKNMPLGRPPNSPEKGLEIFVGQVVQE